MKNPTLKILIGIPASGKSTWAKEFVSKNDNWCIVSRDDFRYGWQNRGWCTPKIEAIISDMVDHSIETLLGRGINVIYDATNVKAKYLDHFKKFKHIASIEYQIFDVPKEVAHQRNKERERSVPDDVIEKMHNAYLSLLESYDFKPIKRTPKKYIAPDFDSQKENAIIVDIDGTLAHTSGKRSPYDMELVHLDDSDYNVKRVVNALHYEFDIICLSGREDSCYHATKDWLEENGILHQKLLMRKTGDSRKDSIIKEEIFWNDIEPNYNVIAVLDDRDQVVKMWRSLGLKCLQVEPGNF